MNTKIQKLKIENYKRKLAAKYSFLSVNKVFYGNEDLDDNNLIDKIINSDDVKIKTFSIYDIKSHAYTNEVDEYRNALDFFKKKLSLFDENEDIIFNILYNQEEFRIQCPYSKFALHFNDIDDIEESIIINNEPVNKLVAILRMEYSFDVLSYVSDESFPKIASI